jgi:hypothetical protein
MSCQDLRNILANQFRSCYIPTLHKIWTQDSIMERVLSRSFVSLSLTMRHCYHWIAQDGGRISYACQVCGSRKKKRNKYALLYPIAESGPLCVSLHSDSMLAVFLLVLSMLESVMDWLSLSKTLISLSIHPGFVVI